MKTGVPDRPLPTAAQPGGLRLQPAAVDRSDAHPRTGDRTLPRQRGQRAPARPPGRRQDAPGNRAGATSDRGWCGSASSSCHRPHRPAAARRERRSPGGTARLLRQAHPKTPKPQNPIKTKNKKANL